MQDDKVLVTREWVSVDDAFLACQTAGLDRTKKTIRSWCRNEDVDAQKQTTPIGDRWMVEKKSLDVKISYELDFQRSSSGVQTSPNRFEPDQPEAKPVRTRADYDELGQTGSNGSEPDSSDEAKRKEFDALRSKVRSLEIDKTVRDSQIEFLSAQNEKGQSSLLAQSRYIGHLETQVRQLGGRPDQRFLEAPMPNPEQAAAPEIVDPRQSPLAGVQ